MTTASTAFRALGTTASLLVTDPARLPAAAALLREELDAIDLACSRFRADSEISRLHETAGREVRISALLAEALGAALRAARLTGGLVDPTVGAAVRALGYDRDFALIAGGERSGSAAGGGAGLPRPGDGRAGAAEGPAGLAGAAESGREVAWFGGGPAGAAEGGAGSPLPGGVRVDPAPVADAAGPGPARQAALAAVAETAPPPAVPAPGWHRVLFDPALRLVVLPRGVHLDLGATAKALAADRAARRIHLALGCGVLVNLGGDLRVAGPELDGGWQVALGDDHAEAVAHPDARVALGTGGLATSGTTKRRWRHGGRTVHHIVDPRTGDVAEPCWRTVSVAAKSTVDANTASTAAVVLGAGAPAWLARRRLPARLTGVGGEVVTTPGWPGERKAA